MSCPGLRWLRHVIVAVWLCAVLHLPACCSLSIDQLISKAMKSPGGYGFLYDKVRQTVRVDMDMIFTLQEWARLTSAARNDSAHVVTKRQAIKPNIRGRYWPRGVIYYRIEPFTFSRRDVRVLHAAMNEWMRYTCVKFVAAHPRNWNRIHFVDGDGCASSVGMARGPQAVTLSRGCRQKGVVIHELGHVLGFNHEQTRPDRDYYVKIRRENIPDHLEYNFLKYKWDVVQDLGVPYDYLSIMHYGKDAFSANGRLTIETLDRDFQNLIGNRQGLSFRDIKSANLLYNCRDTVANCHLRDEDCPGEGFISKDCTCWCPTLNYRLVGPPYYVCYPDKKQGSRAGSGSGYEGDTDSQRGGSGDRNKAKTSQCADQHDSCSMWAARGECTNNRFYMEAYCRSSCELCDTVLPSCRDEYDGCAFWRDKGYCGRPSHLSIFITSNCRLTCGYCTPAPGPTSSKITPRPCEQNCRDDNKQCQAWARRGECTATADYMMLHCRKACNVCCTADAVN